MKRMWKRFSARLLLAPLLALLGSSGIFAQELPLPAVPDTIRQPQERAAYVMQHFWDALDFSDTLRSCSRPFMEQQVVNFLSLLPHAAPDAAACAFDSLYARASEPLGRAVSEGALQVLAVCLNDEAELQREARDMLPPSWMAAFPLPRFFENPGYSFRHLPLVLLLDEAKRVVGRNPAITDIACMLP